MVRRLLVDIDDAWRRRFPLSRGKYIFMRLHSLLYRCGLWKPEWYSVLPGVEMLIDSRDYISRPILRGQPYEPLVCNFIREQLCAGAVFFDIGANAGLISLIASGRVGTAGRVIAFEPNPEVALRLRANLDRNRAANVDLVQAALSNSNAVLDFYISPADNSGKSSFASENALSGHSVPVMARRLDDLLATLPVGQIDLMKIDVEGHELAVLEGARETILRFRPRIVMEIIPRQLAACGTRAEDVYGFFQSIGYGRKWIDDTNIAFIPGRPAEVAVGAAATRVVT